MSECVFVEVAVNHRGPGQRQSAGDLPRQPFGWELWLAVTAMKATVALTIVVPMGHSVTGKVL